MDCGEDCGKCRSDYCPDSSRRIELSVEGGEVDRNLDEAFSGTGRDVDPYARAWKFRNDHPWVYRVGRVLRLVQKV